MDVTKLSPAPWFAYGKQLCSGNVLAEFESETDAIAAALARNALDVLLRRGDTFLLCRTDDGRCWMVDGPNGWITGSWSNPFTALVEADKKYAANVEGAHASGRE